MQEERNAKLRAERESREKSLAVAGSCEMEGGSGDVVWRITFYPIFSDTLFLKDFETFEEMLSWYDAENVEELGQEPEIYAIDRSTGRVVETYYDIPRPGKKEWRPED